MKIPKVLTDDEWRCVFRKVLVEKQMTAKKAHQLITFHGYTGFQEWYSGRTRSVKIVTLQIIVAVFENLNKINQYNREKQK